MDSTELIERLSFFARLDHDAARAYEKALDDIETDEIRDSLRRFRDDHERHVKDLTAAIRKEGGEPPELTTDMQGVFLIGMTAVQSEMGERAALRAVETGEKYVNYKYRQAASSDFPSHVSRLIERNWADERRHLSYVERRLEAATAPRRALRRTIGLGALGVAASMVIWRQLSAR